MCPICYGTEFVDFNNRKNVRCLSCGSMERTRLAYLIASRSGYLRPSNSVLHIAPESGLFQLFSKIFSDYTGADFNTEPYAKWRPKVKFVDLCDIENTINRKYDLIFHNHVLEHIPCSPSVALSKLKSQLNPGGCMFFSIPVRTGSITTEDSEFKLSTEKRTQLFGQWDHLRMFGDKDLFEFLDPNKDIGIELIDYRDYLSEHCLHINNLSSDICNQLGNSIFKVRSNSYD